MEGLDYSKTPLGTRQTRFLKLFPATDQEEIQGSLFVANLDSAGVYVAISYAWGDPIAIRTVAIDHSLVRTTSSLYHALADIRLRDKTRILWIDGLCINQDDLREKSEQVRHIPIIYGNAHQVLIHLCPGSPEIKLGLDMLLSCLNLIKESRLTEGEFVNEDRLEQLGLPPGNDRAWDALRAVASQPWFRRTWTVQEFVLARGAFFVAGNLAIPWPTMLFGLRAAEMTGLLLMMPGANRTLSTTMSALGP